MGVFSTVFCPPFPLFVLLSSNHHSPEFHTVDRWGRNKGNKLKITVKRCSLYFKDEDWERGIPSLPVYNYAINVCPTFTPQTLVMLVRDDGCL